MPFVDSAESLRAKSHTSDLKPTAILGLLALVGVVLILFGGNVFSFASGASFELASSTEEASFGIPDDSAPLRSQDPASMSQESMPVGDVYVFVSGAVAQPGVYRLSPEKRVGDAIEAAGGFTSEAATDYNNLARSLVDGEQIHVPLQVELEDPSVKLPADIGTTVVGSAVSTQDYTLVNINTATQAELETLPGVGPATASKIIASREAEGPFLSSEDLMRVSGIGEKKYESLSGLICV